MGEVIVTDYTKRLKPWFHLTCEEKAFMVKEAYKFNILSSEEIKDYLF